MGFAVFGQTAHMKRQQRRRAVRRCSAAKVNLSFGTFKEVRPVLQLSESSKLPNGLQFRSACLCSGRTLLLPPTKKLDYGQTNWGCAIQVTSDTNSPKDTAATMTHTYIL